MFRARSRLPYLYLAALALAFASCAQPKATGVNAHLLWPGVTDVKTDQQLDLAKRAGATVVRVDLDWARLEPSSRRQYAAAYLARIDALVSKAASRDIKPLFVVLWTPCWASSAPAEVKQDCSEGWRERGTASYPPTSANDYAETVVYLAKRYGSRVSGWELWNEPNQSYFWTSSNPAASYATLVKAVYPAVKRVSSATVIAGALSLSDFKFTEALYRSGIKGKFDAFSIHPYSFDASPLAPQKDHMDASFIRGVQAVRNVMLRHGDKRPMWLTEFGWHTSNVGVDEARQAEYLTLAYAQIQSWSYVSAGIWYELQNGGPDPANGQHNFGLARYDGTDKPSFAAFQTAAALLQRSRNGRQPRTAPD
jgi:polysaccharide biosynthesis protein PslG